MAGAPLHAEGTIQQGLEWLYHAQYEKARESFDAYVRANPDDPAGYFYLTATDWWHLAQEIEYDLPEIKTRLEENAQRTIAVAKKLYDSSSDPRVQAKASLYWGGAEGLWGRWLVIQEEWVSAYFAGKRGHKMLKQAIKLDPELYDAYLGLGIYDYYTDTLSGIQAVLAAMLIGGDKERGLSELQLAIEKGEHARVEAMCFLIEIYTSEENTPEKALTIAEALHKEFPKSPVMHLIKVSVLYTMKAWEKMIPEAERFLKNAESEIPWFTKHYTSPARYGLGVAEFFGKHDLEDAEKQMRKIIAETDAKSRWVSFARLRLGQIYDLKAEREKALVEYRRAMTGPDLWGLHREAALYLDEPFTFSPANDQRTP